MAGTRSSSAPTSVGRQASNEVYTVEQMRAVLRNMTNEERILTAKSAGIIDENGQLTELYKSWGDKPSRTPEYDE